MVVWSSLRPLLSTPSLNLLKDSVRRKMSEKRIFPFAPSRFQWTKFKDLLNLYFFVGAIPLGCVTLYAYVFIGPATLTETPEDYVPEYWEYCRNPITRFIARYILHDPQQDYEKYLHHIFEEEERVRMRRLEQIIKAKMRDRNDYQAYYYRPVMGKYIRVAKETADYIEAISGE